jgi:hypothetical protein
MMAVWKSIYILVILGVLTHETSAHPLRLSISEIEYSSNEQRLRVSLRLFLMDVREALLFDPDSTELAFCQPNESQNAEPMLMDYLNQFFYVKANGERLNLEIKSKKLHGEGINTALGLVFEQQQQKPLTSLEIKNAVFTDLFFDQNNIIYVHVNENSHSLMLSKETPTHTLEF